MPRILLVDDDKDHLRLFTMILEDGGYSVDAYTDPVAALLKFRPNYYDMAVLDYIMPDLNGLELYRRIREIDPRIRSAYSLQPMKNLARMKIIHKDKET